MSPDALAPFIAQVITGVLSAGAAIWAHRQLVNWRLRDLEGRVKKTEGDVSKLQQRTAALAARIS